VHINQPRRQYTFPFSFNALEQKSIKLYREREITLSTNKLEERRKKTMKRRDIISFLLIASMTISILMTMPPMPAALASSPPQPPNWDYAFAINVTDPENDTQDWSWNETAFMPAMSPPYEAPLMKYGNTAEWDNGTNDWIPGAPFDAARDLTRFMVTYDEFYTFFRIYVRDLVDNRSLQIGASYQIDVSVRGGGMQDCQSDGRTYVSLPVNWERNIRIFRSNYTENQQLQSFSVLQAVITDNGWFLVDDSDATSHQVQFPPLDNLTIIGNVTVEANFDENYVQVAVPWDDFIIGGEMPTYMNVTVMSFKPGEFRQDSGGSPYRTTFDPGAPGTNAREWNIGDKGPVWGPDAADVMPGDKGEIDWTCYNLMSKNWDIIPENRVDGWYDVTVKPITGPTADFTYSPSEPHETWTVTFNASGSLPGYNGTGPDPIVNYTWGFDDGTPIVTEADPIINHTYSTAGTYNVNLTVTTELPRMGSTVKKVRIWPITPYSPLPIIDYLPSTPKVNAKVSFSGLASHPGWNGTHDTTIVSYEWDFGDESTGNGGTIDHTYTTEGGYIVTLNVTDDDGQSNQTSVQVTVSPLEGHGYVHVSSKNSRYFEFDDGAPFFPVGINKGWILTDSVNRGDGYLGKGDTTHTGWSAERYFQEMATHNMNLVRIWMCSWHINLEPYVLGEYDETAAQQLDYILGLAEKYDVYVMLCLIPHTDFTTSGENKWSFNPYNDDNGGPCTNPNDFFTDATAISYIKKRFNYILNRWGSNRRIAIWEFWNEVNLVTGFTEAAAKSWHEAVAPVFRQNDTFRRPLATSTSIPWYDTLYGTNAIDTVAVHTYQDSGYSDGHIRVANRARDIVQHYHNDPDTANKSVIIGEFGSYKEYDDPNYNQPEFENNGVWAAVASGAAGTSLEWASDLYDIVGEMTDDMFDRYLYFERFARGIPWDGVGIENGNATVSGALQTNVYSIQGKGFGLAWVLHTTSGTVSGAKLNFTGLLNHKYTVYLYNDTSGTYIDQYDVIVTSGNLTVNLPGFTTHLAVMVKLDKIAVPTDYADIQDAISAAHWHDRVEVNLGTYYEHLTVNRPLKLVGENRSITIIDGNGTEKVVRITSDNVTFSGFTIRNSGDKPLDTGVSIYGSEHVTFSGNTMTNTTLGIYLWNSNYTNIYHNNFVDNANQAQIANSTLNAWDNDYPPGGNYWSDYAGVDLYSGVFQDGTGSDGIGDTAYVIDGSNQDGYPFMSQDGWENYPITLESNVTITNKTVTTTELHFNVSGPTGIGYVNATMPMGLNATAIKVFVDGAELIPPPFPIITNNGTHYFIYFEFALSTREITIKYASAADVAVTNVTRIAASYYDTDYVYPKWYAPPPGRTRAPYKVNVTVKNLGSNAEPNLQVGVYFKNATYTGVIGTTVIASLGGGAETTLTFTWDLTASVGRLIGKATIFANVTVVSDDINVTNNEFTDGQVFLKWMGDTDGAIRVQPNIRKIDIVDVGPLVIAWGATPGDPKWDSRCDYNMDGKIDTWDVSMIVVYWGTTYTDKLIV